MNEGSSRKTLEPAACHSSGLCTTSIPLSTISLNQVFTTVCDQLRTNLQRSAAGIDAVLVFSMMSPGNEPTEAFDVIATAHVHGRRFG